MSNTKYAPVSVIIPCYNCEQTVHRAAKSVYDQTIRPAEVILIDDASSDSTLNCLLALKDQYGSSWLKVIQLSENGGPSVARNIGWDAASQPYIAFLDADDSWHPLKLEVQHKWMECHPDAAMTSHLYEWIRVGAHDNRLLPANWRIKPISRVGLLLKNYISTPTVMLKRELPYRFYPGKRYSEDYLLWLTILLEGHSIWNLEVPLAYLFKAPYGQGGLSGHLKEMELGELDTYRQLYNMNLIGTLELQILRCWSYIKFLKRLFLPIQKNMAN